MIEEDRSWDEIAHSIPMSIVVPIPGKRTSEILSEYARYKYGEEKIDMNEMGSDQ